LLAHDENSGQRGYSSFDYFEFRLGFASAQVCESPGYISHETGPGLSLIKDVRNRVYCSSVDDTGSAGLSISCDVAQPPDDLLNHLDVWGVEQSDKVVNHSLLNQVAHVVRGSRCHIGQTPGSLELKLGLGVREVVDQQWKQVRIDNSLDGWSLLNGE
jgi:hypothetical protein